jgi:adenine-specific DNA-methyltransferase
MMRDRLSQIRDLLDPASGSIWVHCDDSEQARLRMVMDEVFFPSNWVTTIVWQKRTSRENRAAFSSSHDYIHVYSPAGPTGWRDVRNRLARGSKKLTNPDNDPRGPWESIPFTAQGFRENQMYTITAPNGIKHRPPKGRCWGATEKVYLELLADKQIYFPKNGSGRPRIKQFPEEAKGLVPMTWWQASEVGDNESSKKEILNLFPAVDPFITPKPERFLQRVIEIATNPGEVVLDCFLGSGTTAAVAHKMDRRWIGVERSVETFDNYIVPRLTKVVNGEDPGGVTEQMGWTGGGGFRVLDIAPSMFDEEDGTVYLAAWATSSRLAEACAAQLHYEFEPEPPFAGRRGRTRLAVVDGLLNEDVVRLLVANLPADERLVACGTAIDPAAQTLLRELRGGSSIRKIPASILQDYRKSSWVPQAPSSNANGTVPATDVPATDEVLETSIEAR